MNSLVFEAPTASPWRLGAWVGRAWTGMGWRHVVLALVVHVVYQVFGPFGGIISPPLDGTQIAQMRFDSIASLLNGGWLIRGGLIVFGVMVADEAFADGVPPLRAYGLALVSLVALVPVVNWSHGVLAGQSRMGPAAMLFAAARLLFQGSLAMTIYAYWRVTQRATRQAQAAETERVRNEQRVQTAKLVALQSRVEPQMLFDALGRIGEMHVRDPRAADALLADLIALLRALLPGARADNSTVEREFALVDAWLRVTGGGSQGAAPVVLRIAADARPVGIAPMLVLPLLRSVLALPHATRFAWTLSAESIGDRLVVKLEANEGRDDQGEAASLLASANVSALDDRIGLLFGRFANLTVSARPPTMTLNLPRLQEEDPDDDGLDR